MIVVKIYREHSRELSWFCGKRELECFRCCGEFYKAKTDRKAGARRSLEGGPPLVLKDRHSILWVNVDYKNKILRKPTQ
jgi:hypothetical protein